MKSYLQIIILVAVFAAVLFYKMKGPDIFVQEEQYSFPSNVTLATWDWNDPIERYEEMDEYIAQLKQEGFSTVYLSLNSFIDVYEMSTTDLKRDEDLWEYDQKLSALIGAAQAQGISVEGLFGDKTWANPSHRYLNALSVQYVHDFNQKFPETRLKGIQFDVEPHGQESFEDNKLEYSQYYLETVEEIVTKMKSLNMDVTLGFAIPIWYDGSNGFVSDFDYKEKKRSLLEHFLWELNNYQNSYVALMDYRNEASGKNGSIALAKEEFDIIRDNNMNIKLIIGQETDDVEPASITFYGVGKNKLRQAVGEISAAYGQSPIFAGVAIHNISSYFKLEE